MRVFIVEDDKNIQEIERYALQNSGYDVSGFENGTAFFGACRKQIPDLIILDIMLPGEDGLEILKKIRSDAQLKQLPVMLLTAKTTELDKVKGLEIGADDYMTKPFGVMEFVSRVKALLRRANLSVSMAQSYGILSLDEEKHTVTVEGTRCALTHKEFELLRYLMKNNGIVMSRNKLMDKVWGFDYEGESRTVDMHIKTLRQKLGAAGGMIKTVRNVGYKFEG